MRNWYQTDYLANERIYVMTTEDEPIALFIMSSVWDPVNRHHEPHSLEEACEAWDNHYAFEDTYDLNPDSRYQNSWLGSSMFNQTMCEFGFQEGGVRQLYDYNYDTWVDFHVVFIYHMYHPIRKGYKHAIN